MSERSGDDRTNARGSWRQSFRRVRALIRKEALQVMRDPSSLVVAFLLPALLLFLFGFGISFDATRLKVGLVVEQPTPETASFVAALADSPYFDVRRGSHRQGFVDQLSAGRINGIVVLAGDFSERLARGDTAGIQVITDGSDPNTAGLATGYVRGAWQVWQSQRALGRNIPAAGQVTIDARFWFNAELESRRFLVPGSISLIMMMIGSLLTALVVSREWERGTMEALLATPVSTFEFIIGKMVPNFALGMCAMVVCVTTSIVVFDIPLRGSIVALFAFTAVFLLVALGIGLLISTVARTQFLASQLAMLVAFLPGVYLSGFLFEVASMPAVLRGISKIIPAAYYVRGLNTILLAGDIGSVLWPAAGVLVLMSVVLFTLTIFTSRQRLD
ncbi:MAG: ABC transporter permease [Hyphomicrobiaceae bacterium]